MTIVFTAPPQGGKAFEERCTAAGLQVICVGHARDFAQYPGAGLYIDACFDGTFTPMATPLLFHCPALPFNRLATAPANSARFCAWPGFWEKNTWEIAAKKDVEGIIASALAPAGIKALPVADVAGLIAPRIVCTLINEAAFTMAEDVATAADIDTAMKLGTNYPFGPVEWAKKIGFAGIHEVLNAMALENERYLPHPAMQQLTG